MTSDNYILEALILLRKFLLEDGSVIGLTWPYSDIANLREQDNALNFLVSAKVVETDTLDNILNFKDDDFRFEGVASLSDQSNWKRTIKSFDKTAYEQLCLQYGLEPYAQSFTATLKLNDGVVPIVHVSHKDYTLPTLHSGSASDLINYCYRNPNEIITRDVLKAEVATLHSLSNIRDTLRNSPFSHKEGLLFSFIETSPNTAKLYTQAKLTSEQLERIKARAS